MSLLSRLEKKFGRYAVPDLTLILIIGQVVLYVLLQINPEQNGVGILERIVMTPDKVLAGEVWRLVAFLFFPPTSKLIFAIFFWYLFYLMGTALEVTWGAFRYTIFLAIGYLASIAFAFGVYFALGPAAGNLPVTNGFLYGTVFLAFARLYPEFTMYIFFVLPVKIRWLAMLQWIGYAWGLVFGPWMVKAMIVASVLNYLLFFGHDIWLDVKHGHRRMRHQAKTLRSPTRLVHKCRTCGLTSDDAPQMQFRYCSKCEGEACYCSAHLRDHTHIVPQIGEGDAAERS